MSSRKHNAYLGLGSNLGRRERNIEAALNALQRTRGVEVAAISGLYETEPVGGPEEQPKFINAAAHLRTTLSAPRLLAVCGQIEEALGRKREIRWGPRTLDLDLLIYDSQIVAGAELTLPHPLLHERRFVLAPLAEIAPDLVHPVLGQSVRELLDKLDDSL